MVVNNLQDYHTISLTGSVLDLGDLIAFNFGYSDGDPRSMVQIVARREGGSLIVRPVNYKPRYQLNAQYRRRQLARAKRRRNR